MDKSAVYGRINAHKGKGALALADFLIGLTCERSLADTGTTCTLLTGRLLQCVSSEYQVSTMGKVILDLKSMLQSVGSCAHICLYRFSRLFFFSNVMLLLKARCARDQLARIGIKYSCRTFFSFTNDEHLNLHKEWVRL